MDRQSPCIKTIGVIGLGMVGGTIYNYFRSKQNFFVKGWAPSKQLNPIEEVINSEYIFVCVPTPFNWKKKKYDLTILRETLNRINGSGKKVIIKSTIPPMTTIKLQDEFRHLYLFFNPEFLSEATAQADFMNPDRQIVGYTPKSMPKAIEILHLLPMSPYDVIMTSTEAEILKYVNNFHGALMVIFSNFVYDLCEKTGSHYDKVRKGAQASKWVGSPMGRMYWNITQGGFRGYGGKCFPKDINSLIQWCHENKVECEVLKATQKANERILKTQLLNEQTAEKINNR